MSNPLCGRDREAIGLFCGNQRFPKRRRFRGLFRTACMTPGDGQITAKAVGAATDPERADLARRNPLCCYKRLNDGRLHIVTRSHAASGRIEPR
jgi:hypothetical protein